MRKTDPDYGIRKRLLRNREDLSDDKFADMWNRLVDLGEVGEEILSAWIAKEKLRDLLGLAGTGPARSAISAKLFTFYHWCLQSGIGGLERLAATVGAWQSEVIAAIELDITNAAREGINRLIKVEARNAFGFRNPTSQREVPRILPRPAAAEVAAVLEAICSRRPRTDVPLGVLRDRVLFETACVCGARASEVCGMYVEDLDLRPDDEHARVHGKGRTVRTVLLDDRGYVALLRLYLARSGYTSGPLFCASINGQGGPLSYD